MNGIRKRRWYQLTLRTLLVLMTVACIASAGLAYWRGELLKLEATAAREKMLANYERLGLRVTLPGAESFHEAWLCPTLEDDLMDEVVYARFYREKVATDADLAIVARMTKVQNLYLDHSNVTGPGLVHIAGLKDVRWLLFNNSPINDAGLAHIAGLTTLTDLNLYGTNVTDAGLVHISRLTKLRCLALSYTNVTDAGLVHLVNLSELVILNLDHTQVTDAELPQLARHTKLELIDLSSSKVSHRGVSELQKLLPKATVYKN